MYSYKTIESFIDDHKDQNDKESRYKPAYPPGENTTIEKLSVFSTTVSETELKSVLIAIEEQVSTYISNPRDGHGVVIDFISIIGKKVGWSVIYVLLRTMKKYKNKFNFLLDTELSVYETSQYTTISYFGVTHEDKILNLIQLRDGQSFSGMDFSFSDTDIYLNVPQFVGDLHQTIEL